MQIDWVTAGGEDVSPIAPDTVQESFLPKALVGIRATELEIIFPQCVSCSPWILALLGKASLNVPN